jgi:hypothetical protein
MSDLFPHQHAAHCETGVISTILRANGLDISEPMAFGLASGMSYAYLPIIKINGQPLISYRLPPRMITRMLSWRIPGLTMKFRTFRHEAEGQRALDEILEQHKVAGLQTSVFFLPYFPQDMRFHFNAHNLLVYGREDDNYLISDPVFSHVVKVDAKSLSKARFAKGALAPKGLMYYPTKIPDSIEIARILPKAIKMTCRTFSNRNPFPFSGVKGMRRVAGHIGNLERKDQHQASLYLGHLVRMQEEIGTGGAGFRFMYAAFLQEAGEITGSQLLTDLSEEMTDIGDEWRMFAFLCARKSRNRGDVGFIEVANQLRKVAKLEQNLFARLSEYRQ